MAQVRLSQLYKTYEGKSSTDRFHAVKGINLEIRDKEFMILVGPSGCGKSTTLRMIAGLESITSGQCKIGDKLVNNVAPKDRDIAMVFQSYALYPHMTVYENIAFGLKLKGVKRDEILEKVTNTSRLLGISGYLERKPKALSGGQRQRVALGRAIVRNPAVFLFDEPLSNLDAKMRLSMRAEIKRLHQQLNTTMIYVTHDQVEAMTMGDRICVMNKGEIVQVDYPTTVYDQPANMFVAGFIGSPPMNFFHGRICSRDEDLFFSTNSEQSSLSFRLSDKHKKQLRNYYNSSIVLGVRPERIFTLSDEKNSDLKDFHCNASITNVEPMGSETYLHIDVDSDNVVARLNSGCKFRFNEKIAIGFNESDIHFFDPQSKNAIR